VKDKLNLILRCFTNVSECHSYSHILNEIYAIAQSRAHNIWEH